MSVRDAVRSRLSRLPAGTVVTGADVAPGKAREQDLSRFRAALAYLKQRGFLKHEGGGRYRLIAPIERARKRAGSAPIAGRPVERTPESSRPARNFQPGARASRI